MNVITSKHFGRALLIALFLSTAIACKKPAVNLEEILPTLTPPSTPALTVTRVTTDYQKLNSGSTTTFQVSATGDGMVFSWKLDGAEDATRLPFANTTASFMPDAAIRGNHVISLNVQDMYGQVANLSWNVAVDQLLAAKGTSDNLKFTINYATPYSVVASTTNGNPLTYTWKLDGSASPYLPSGAATSTFSTGASLIGNHTISVLVSDGELSTTLSWPVEVNAFSQGCNAMAVGTMCAVAGLVNVGDNVNPLLNPELIHTNPRYSTTDELGNLIWTDYLQNLVWYWNSTAATVVRFGRTIPSGAAVVIAGTGAAQLPSGLPALASTVAVIAPTGVAFDSTGGKLFVSAMSASRIFVIDAATGMASVLFTGSPTVHTGSAIAQGCGFPADLAIDGTWLYLACSSTGTANARVKKLSLADLLTVVIVAGGGASYTDGGVATSQFVDGPFGLWVDSDGVFITSSTNYILYVNTSGAGKTFFGGASTLPGSVRRIIGNGVGSAPSTQQLALSYPVQTARDIYRNGESFWFTHANNYISVANNSAASVTIDTKTILPNSAMFVDAAANGFNGYDSGVNSTKFSSVYGLSYFSSSLIVSDGGNSLLRSVDLSTNTAHQVLGSGNYRQSPLADDTLLPATDHVLFGPRGLAYESSTNSLYIADISHGRIRKLGSDGRMVTALGTGNTGSSFNSNVSPLSAAFNLTGGTFTGLAMLDNIGLLVVHPFSHLINAWNLTGTAQTIMGRTVSANKFSTVAGLDGVSGNATSGSIYALAGMNTPSGIAYRSSSSATLIADTSNHCIKSVDSAGVISAVAGVCGTAGNTNGARLSARLSNPQNVLVDSLGNLYIADYSNSRVVYVNLSAGGTTALGTAVPSDAMQSVLSIPFPVGMAYVSSLNALCVASYSNHYVKCYDTTTGILLTSAGNTAFSQPGAPISGSMTDGVVASSQMLTNPISLSSDGTNLYISDYQNGIIHKWRLN